VFFAQDKPNNVVLMKMNKLYFNIILIIYDNKNNITIHFNNNIKIV
jgi:hypothetical protein